MSLRFSSNLQEVYEISKHLTLHDKEYYNVHRIERICEIFQQISEAAVSDPENVLEPLHDNYPQIIDCIFGGSGFVGLIKGVKNLSEDRKSISLSKVVLELFTPAGAFFDLVKLLLQENRSYLVPVEALPLALYSKSEPDQQPKLAVFLKDKIFIHNSQRSLRLNAYEFYIYSCLTFPLQVGQESPPTDKKESTIFQDFLNLILEDIFPLCTSSFEKASHLKLYFNEGLSNDSLPRFFLDVFFELWFNIDPSLTKNQVQYVNIAPKAPGMELIKTVCLYFQRGSSCFLPCAEDISSKLLQNFWQSLQFEFQPRFFHFLKEVFAFQNFTQELLWVVDLWVSYITPWKMEGWQDFSQYSYFIVDNYLFYKELLLDFLYRCLESHFLAESLGRSAVLSQSETTLLGILNIYCDDRVLRVLREADAALNTLTSRQVFLFSIDPDTSAACFSFDTCNSGQFDSALEAHLKRLGDSPVFNHCLVSPRRTPSWKKDLHGVFSGLARLVDPSNQIKLDPSPEFPPLPSHYYYETIVGFFNRLLSFCPGQRSLELAQPNYLTKQEYQSIADLIAKILNIPV
ncbi:sphingomyelin phosphodiesterase 4, neutral membrane (neutral sphingomyelinase-3) [Entomophthora muscae]|uniref:Sphingomyelin phosphodiesterase 4, neutral membrane (Neutral sphingomyelinase-3) n=1 Tax=Entomophthora muscae TaxID=34485 RepID=A0ACC2T042_9FUNG|nr:sphingomyelin phosphodiesterase 4, neutral membrane (neutral sphingomyelinase-3) [Entomophthora muscae]